MTKLFSLRNLCGFDITRPVCDMAAFFDYELAESDRFSSDVQTHAIEQDVKEQIPQAELCVAYAINEHRVEASLHCGSQSFTSDKKCQLKQDSEPTSGELTRCVKLAVVAVLEQATSSKPAMPWGVLTGVRPGKLAHKLLDAGYSSQALPQYLEEAYLLPQQQGQLLTDIAVKQKQILPDNSRFQDAGIYIGVPYCPSRCSYCSFPAGIVPADEES
ncbi:MAG: hypothetical protein ACI3WU_00245, partial [Phascolarctobacterium sp.]